MGLPLALSIASTAFSFMGSMSAASAAKREAAMQQRQLEQEKKMGQLRALQEHNLRLANLQTFINTNEAIAGISGRDIGSDRSLKAIQKKAVTEMATESGRARIQNLAQLAKLSNAQAMAGERGRNLARAYRYQAFGTLLSGGMKANKLIGGPAPDPFFHGGT